MFQAEIACLDPGRRKKLDKAFVILHYTIMFKVS